MLDRNRVFLGVASSVIVTAAALGMYHAASNADGRGTTQVSAAAGGTQPAGGPSAVAVPTTTAPVSVDPSTPAFPPPTFVGDLQAARQYPYAGVRLDLPAATAHPAVPWSAAYALCQTSAPCLMGSAPTIELAIFSDDQYGATASEFPNGSQAAPLTNLPFQNRLAWVLTWKHTSCEVHGPPGLPPPAASFASGCDHVDFIDAMTGVYLDGITGKTAF